MKLNHHAALQAIGATMNKQHSTGKTEYWNLPASLEDKDDFYNVRETIPFTALLCGFRDSGLIIYLDKPKATDAMIAAAPDLLEALENACNVMAAIVTGDLDGLSPNSPALIEARAAIAKARGE